MCGSYSFNTQDNTYGHRRSHTHANEQLTGSELKDVISLLVREHNTIHSNETYCTQS